MITDKGFSVGAGAGGGFTNGLGLYVDPDTGDFGWYDTSGGTTASDDFFGGAGASGTVDITKSPSESQFSGPSSVDGASSGDGWVAGVDVSSNDAGKAVTFHVGGGGGTPAEVHHMHSNTHLHKKGSFKKNKNGC